jgi:hypothetical protein
MVCRFIPFTASRVNRHTEEERALILGPIAAISCHLSGLFSAGCLPRAPRTPAGVLPFRNPTTVDFTSIS